MSVQSARSATIGSKRPQRNEQPHEEAFLPNPLVEQVDRVGRTVATQSDGLADRVAARAEELLRKRLVDDDHALPARERSDQLKSRPKSSGSLIVAKNPVATRLPGR